MGDPRIVPFEASVPHVAADVFIADTARVIGKVEIGAGSSVWYGTVVRGDVHWIRIGRQCNLQDMTLVHVTSGRHPAVIGDRVTVGHRATLHGCTIEDEALIGMGATVLDAAVIGTQSMVAAGALVTPGTHVTPRTLWVGAPARYKRDLRAEEIQHLQQSALHYETLAGAYRLSEERSSC